MPSATYFNFKKFRELILININYIIWLWFFFFLFGRLVPFSCHQRQLQFLSVQPAHSPDHVKNGAGLESQSFSSPPQHERIPISHLSCSQKPRLPPQSALQDSLSSLSCSSSIVASAAQLLETGLQISPQSQSLPQAGLHIGTVLPSAKWQWFDPLLIIHSLVFV